MEREGVGLDALFSVDALDAVLVKASVLEAGNDRCPDPVMEMLHWVSRGVPIVEITDDAHALHARRPHYENESIRAGFWERMATEGLISALCISPIKKIKIRILYECRKLIHQTHALIISIDTANCRH